MDRREALQRVGLLIGGSVLGANAFLAGCKSADDKEASDKVTFSQPDMAGTLTAPVRHARSGSAKTEVPSHPFKLARRYICRADVQIVKFRHA